MANSKITWVDKESLVTDPTIAEKNKVTDSNMNEIKNVVNENADQIILSDTEPTSNDNEIWVEPNGTIPYVNSEVNIGPTNVSNTPVWFKQGKNLFDKNNIRSGYGFNDQGQEIIATGQFVGLQYIQVKPNTKYILSCVNSNNNRVVICEYNSSKTFIQRDIVLNANKITITTTANTYFVRCSGMLTDLNDMQFELGDTRTTYEDYITPKIIIDNREIYTKPEMTYGKGTLNSNYIGSAERNNYYKNGNLVCFVCGCTANATWTGQAEIISNLPKPIRNFNFIGFNANQALPVRFELTTNGVLRKYYSNNSAVNGDVVDLYITYFTTD